MSNPEEKLAELKKQYAKTTEDIIPLLPMLLALIDARESKDITLTKSRMDQGYYGKVVDGSYIAPSTGPFQGILKDVSQDSVKKMKEALGG